MPCTDFDFSALDSSEYKEDAVREDLIAPLLRRLGYKPTGSERMQRSKTLVHPFVMIGSKRNSINIAPDYTLYVDDEPVVIIEAKGPSEEIVRSHHVEQAFSYAIHPTFTLDWISGTRSRSAGSCSAQARMNSGLARGWLR